MKIFILALLISFEAVACRWSTIRREGDEFVYSPKCHVEVGKLVLTEPLKQEQVAELTKAIELKDLAIEKANMRAAIWENETNEQYNMLLKNQKSAKLEKIAYFGLGVVSVLLGAWAVNQTK